MAQSEKGFGYFFGIPASMNCGILTYLKQDRVLKPAKLWTAKKPRREPGRPPELPHHAAV